MSRAIEGQGALGLNGGARGVAPGLVIVTGRLPVRDQSLQVGAVGLLQRLRDARMGGAELLLVEIGHQGFADAVVVGLDLLLVSDLPGPRQSLAA